jgi:Matrixin
MTLVRSINRHIRRTHRTLRRNTTQVVTAGVLSALVSAASLTAVSGPSWGKVVVSRITATHTDQIGQDPDSTTGTVDGWGDPSSATDTSVQGATQPTIDPWSDPVGTAPDTTALPTTPPNGSSTPPSTPPAALLPPVATAVSVGTPAVSATQNAAPGQTGRWSPTQRRVDGTPMGWNPCSPIEIVVDSNGAYDSFDEDIATTLAILSGATGLKFVPSTTADVTGPVITIGWSDETADPELAGSVVGYGGNEWSSTDDWYANGRIVLDRESQSPSGFASGLSWGPVILHEFGHVIGLDHVQDESELMFPSARPDGPVSYAPGDLEGLRTVTGVCA